MKSPVAPWLDPDRTFMYMKGRVALYAILEAAGIGAGDEVVLPGFTCVVVPAAVRYLGATPCFHDISPATLSGDPALARELIGPNTRAVIIQHNFGYPCDPGGLREICSDRGILLVEDCAHSVGAAWRDRPVGTLGDAAFCSLQWSKPATTGLGGIALVHDETLRESVAKAFADYREPEATSLYALRVLSWSYGSFYSPRLYWMARDAYRAVAGLGIVQGSSTDEELVSGLMPAEFRTRYGESRRGQALAAIRSIDAGIRHRNRIADLYRAALAPTGCFMVPVRPGDRPSPLRFPLLVAERGRLSRAAREARIELGDWFNSPLHPIESDAARFGYRRGACPVAEFAAEHVINLPTHRHVTDAEARRVVDFILANRALLLTPAAFSPRFSG